MARKRKKRARQETFGFTRWGGRRRGAGRKPKGERAGVSHATRARLAARHPVHVTMRLRDGLPSLRRHSTREVLRRRFAAGCERFGFRLVHYSIQSNHLHLLAEAKERRSLSRGMQGLAVRIAKGLNKHWGRKGRVFADRYHDRLLRTPREVRTALVYVLRNHARHGVRVHGLDPYSSSAWFDGWRDAWGIRDSFRHLAEARTWLLSIGWRLHGLLGEAETPSAS